MNIKEQKTELDKTDIYENVRKDATAVASRANARHQQKTNRPFKQKCQLPERNARNARQKKKSV